MSESGEEPPGSVEPQRINRRLFLKKGAQTGAKLAAAVMLGGESNLGTTNSSLKDPSGTELGEMTTDNAPQGLENIPEGLGVALAAKKVIDKIGSSNRARSGSSSMFEKSLSRRTVIREGARGATAAAMLAAAGVSTASFLKDTPSEAGQSSQVESEDSDSNTQRSNAEVLEKVEEGSSFDEMFPNATTKDKEVLRVQIDDYKDITENGGIGTLEANNTMRELLVREFKLESGEVLNFEKVLQNEARKNGLNPNIVKGVIFIESHGRSSVESGADAVGIAQFKVDAAERYGLIVRNKDGVIIEDYRDNPFMSVKAQCEYLNDLKELFGGNMGIAVWAYHAGEGNVMTALREYYKNTQNIDIGDFGESSSDVQNVIATRVQGLMSQEKLNVFRLLQNPKVREFIKNGIPAEKKPRLEDDTENYSVKATTAAEYFEKSPLGLPIPKAA